MRRWIPVLSILWGAASVVACGGEHGQVEVELRLSSVDCNETLEPCGVRHHTLGIVAESDDPELDDVAQTDGDLVLYADFETQGGALAILEIAVPSTGDARIRYREIQNDRVSFKGEIVDQSVQLHALGERQYLLDGEFSFRAVDGTNPEAPQFRKVVLGQVTPTTVVITTETPPAPVPRDPASPNDPPKPAPTEEPDPDRSRTRTEVGVVVHDGGGCDDPAPSPSSSSGGCDDPSPSSGGGCDGSSGGGCEGDGLDSGGCDSASSSGGGCEADSFDAGGCDSCSTQPSTATQRAQALAALWRLAWPVLLVGWANRRFRRRLASL